MGRRLGAERASAVVNSLDVVKQRVRLGMTQEELGRSLGVTGAMISLIEHGRRRVSYSMACRLAQQLQLRVEDLVIQQEKTSESQAAVTANSLVSTHVVAVVDDHAGVIAGLAGAVAAHGLEIYSLSTHSDATGATVSMVLDPLHDSAWMALHSDLVALPHVHEARALAVSRPELRTSGTVSPRHEVGLRLLSVGFTRDKNSITIMVLAQDRVGLMRDLATKFDCDIRSVGTSVADGCAFLWFIIDPAALPARKRQRLLGQLGAVRGVEEVYVPATLVTRTLHKSA